MDGRHWTLLGSREEADTVRARNEARETTSSEESGKAEKKPRDPEQLKISRQARSKVKEMEREMTLRILKDEAEARVKLRREAREEACKNSELVAERNDIIDVHGERAHLKIRDVTMTDAEPSDESYSQTADNNHFLLRRFSPEIFNMILMMLDHDDLKRLRQVCQILAVEFAPYVFREVSLRGNMTDTTDNELVECSTRRMAYSIAHLNVYVNPNKKMDKSKHRQTEVMPFLEHIGSLKLRAGLITLKTKPGLVEHNETVLYSMNMILSCARNVINLDLQLNMVSASVTACVHGIRFPKLKSFRLHRAQVCQKQLSDFLMKHSWTIRHLDLDEVFLTKGTWYKILNMTLPRCRLDSLQLRAKCEVQDSRAWPLEEQHDVLESFAIAFELDPHQLARQPHYPALKWAKGQHGSQ